MSAVQVINTTLEEMGSANSTDMERLEELSKQKQLLLERRAALLERMKSKVRAPDGTTMTDDPEVHYQLRMNIKIRCSHLQILEGIYANIHWSGIESSWRGSSEGML